MPVLQSLEDLPSVLSSSIDLGWSFEVSTYLYLQQDSPFAPAILLCHIVELTDEQSYIPFTIEGRSPELCLRLCLCRSSEAL